MTLPTDTGHVWYRCAETCAGCQFCRGGFGHCTVCNGFEWSLLATCPGYRLNEDALEAVHRGNVHCFETIRAWKAVGYDVKKKAWPCR